MGANVDLDQALQMLKGGQDGVAQWNLQRQAGAIIPSLESANLNGANLYGADLRLVNLNDSKLRESSLFAADLRGARLRDALLTSADLSRADLSRADLSSADLRMAVFRETIAFSADLHEANLSGALFVSAYLHSAILRRTILHGVNISRSLFREVDLTESRCGYTSFNNTDISDSIGLESLVHDYPSSVSLDTIALSKGKLPATFLRGCGVPDVWIEYIPSLIDSMEPIQFYSCFISHSTRDEDFAKRLQSKMREQGLRVWFAPEDIQGGRKLHEQIDEAIRVYDKLLLVLSRESMQSKWVRDEIRRARKAELTEKRRKLFPIRLVDFEAIRDWECFDADIADDLSAEIREYIIPDFSNWKDHAAFEAAFARLLKDLKAEESTGTGIHPPPATSPETPH
jgi:uncharacterized protein YjbI with pentapeptide repeats